jgi:hypothetical protein
LDFALYHEGRKLAIPEARDIFAIQRWSEDPDLTDELLEGIKRELLRATGFPAWEPSDST